MSEVEEVVRRGIEYAILVNDTLNDNNITQEEYEHEIKWILKETCSEIQRIQSGVEIL